MEKDKIYKCLQQIFVSALTISEISKFFTFYIQKVGQGNEVQFSQLHLSIANVKIYKHHFLTFWIFAKNTHTGTYTHRNRHATGYRWIL